MEKYKNNIKNILTIKGISINKMAEDLGMHYRTLHALVNREFIDTTKFGNIADIATYLDVSIDLLYVNVDDVKIQKEGVNVNSLKLVEEGTNLKKIIKRNKQYTYDEYMKHMTSTIYNLQNSAERKDTGKYLEIVLNLYTTNKLPIPFPVQELLNNTDNEDWGTYAVAFITGMMTGEE